MSQRSSSASVDGRQRTAYVVIGTVHHISCMDELVAGAFHAQLRLRIPQDNLPPAETEAADCSVMGRFKRALEAELEI